MLRRFSRQSLARLAVGIGACAIGCSARPGGSATTDSSATKAAVATAHASAAPLAAGCGDSGTACMAPKESCLVEDEAPAADQTERRRRDAKSGQEIIEAGTALDPKAPLVAPSELLAHPQKYRDKIVTVEGPVAAMCHLRRGWFAISSGQNDVLRAVTAPRFLVPSSAIGKQARVSGKVELKVISADVQEHQRSEHGLQTPTRTLVLLRATGLRLNASGA